MIELLKKIGQPIALSLIILSLFVMGCSRSKAPDLLEFSGKSMGTWYSIKLVKLPQGVNEQAVADAITKELDDVNKKMSTYLPYSEISTLNNTPIKQPYKVSKSTFDVLIKALEIWRLSVGAFDVTVGPLVNLWGFGPEGNRTVPSEKDMVRAWKRVGSDGLILHLDEQSVEKQKNLYIDLSAIAKGYAVDRVAVALENLGIRQYLVEVGGELRAGNSKAVDLPWKVAIEEPVANARKIHRVVELNNVSMATSGDYRNYFEQDGKRYSHTIDPRDGKPVSHNLASVSVIAADCMDADAWATALMVLGPEQGMEVAEANHLAVYMITKTKAGFEAKFSEPFRRYLAQ